MDIAAFKTVGAVCISHPDKITRPSGRNDGWMHNEIAMDVVPGGTEHGNAKMALGVAICTAEDSIINLEYNKSSKDSDKSTF